MAIKVKIPRNDGSRGRHTSRKRNGAWRYLSHPAAKVTIAVFVVLGCVCFGVFAWYYLKYERIVDRRMSGQIFSNSAKIYALPHTVRVGEQVSAREIAAELRRAGYTEARGEGQSRIGTYHLFSGGIEVRPGPESYHTEDIARIEISGQAVSRILGSDNKEVSAYELEPQLVTALFNTEQRAKRNLVRYQDIPKVMVDAVLAVEDRRFFQHSGVNYFRLMEAALIDLRAGQQKQGGSTITMQVSRAFFLSRAKTLKRKLTEMLIAFELEQKFTKQQIFELYANQVDLGQRGSFAIVGFSEAARSYFNKDLQSITLPEAALLAGLIQRPSYLSPYRHPERALSRRNLVLDSMVETGAITRLQADRAKATPLNLAPPNVEASDAPYFVDLVRDQLLGTINENDLNEQAYRIYTTLDPELQRAAAEAVQEGMKLVDEQVTRLRTRKIRVGKGKKAVIETKVAAGPPAQVALVAMDPRTGNVLALVGGRNYSMSQLNHAVAKRPTGSIFKPFVYAAAMNTALSDNGPILTPVSLIDDSPTTFSYGDQIYEPRNYKDEYHGQVTARYALALSLNNATVKLAETVGYDTVAALAQTAGMSSVKATPAMALGAYDATPLDMAAAYTVFANQGVRVSPVLIRSVHDAKGDVVNKFPVYSRSVLDPRVAYVMTSMMEGVLNFGTGYEVRRRGFFAPAAGKTGTSHDGWFAGYTPNLICIVWVGFDDYSDLRLSGAQTAAPIWAEFMKRASAQPEYRNAGAFPQPPGAVDVQLDKITNLLATPSCPETYTAAFVAGTEPVDACDRGPSDRRNVFQKIFGIGMPTPVPPPPSPPTVIHRPQRATSTSPSQHRPPAQAAAEQPEKKKGFLGKFLGIFGGDDSETKQDRQVQQE